MNIYIYTIYNIQSEPHSHTPNKLYQIIYGRSLFVYNEHCTHQNCRVRSLCELMFHFLQVNFHLEYNVVFNWKANYFIVSIFGSLTFSFIYYTTLFCSVVPFCVTQTYFSNNIFSVWQQNCKTVEHNKLRISKLRIMWMRTIAQMAWITLFQQLICF